MQREGHMTWMMTQMPSLDLNTCHSSKVSAWYCTVCTSPGDQVHPLLSSVCLYTRPHSAGSDSAAPRICVKITISLAQSSYSIFTQLTMYSSGGGI